jgi:hypothetical protein
VLDHLTASATLAQLVLTNNADFALFYMDPGSLMPVGSAIAAVIGIFLMFWHRILGVVRRVLGRGPAAADSTLNSSTPEAGQDPKSAGHGS